MSRKKLARLLEEAHDKFRTKWWRYALFRTRRQDEADEMVQDAILRTLRTAPALETADEVNRYVWYVLRNTSARAVLSARTKVRTVPFEEELPGHSERTQNASALDLLLEVEDGALREKIIRLAGKHLRDLPGPIRECIELHLLHEPPLRYREIAIQLNIGKSTVGDRINKGLQILARLVLDELDNEP